MVLVLLAGIVTITISLILLGLTNRFFLHPLRNTPGPIGHALSIWPLLFHDFQGSSTRRIHRLHDQYGPVVRIAPDHISFNSIPALKTIYGAGSPSQRTTFYKIFEPYGVPTMFTLASGREHAGRKKLLARVYAKSAILQGSVAESIEERVRWFVDLIEKNRKSGLEVDIGAPLHFFTLDVSSDFIYGPELSTTALKEEKDRRLLADFEHPLRRSLSWAVVHGVPTPLIDLCLRLWSLATWQWSQPTPFTQLRAYGLQTFRNFRESAQAQLEADNKQPQPLSEPPKTLLAQLWSHRFNLEDLSIASECVDHLLAGIETTRNTLLFLIWTLSLPEHSHYQDRLRAELTAFFASEANSDNKRKQNIGFPTVAECDSLPYLNAVVKEALRLYAPLPALQPRVFETEMVVDGVVVPAGTVVSCSPYSMHRHEAAFPKAGEFRPERWLDEDEAEKNEEEGMGEGGELFGSRRDEARKWFWPFSSGARMCTGSHLAMAEITTLIAAIYSRYRTEVAPDILGISPAITSRFEIFFDERFDRYDEHRCPILFHELSTSNV